MINNSWSAWITRAILYVILIVGGYLLVGWFIQDRVIYPVYFAQPEAYYPGSKHSQLLHINTDAGQSAAIFIPGKNVSAQHPGPVVIFATGNGELPVHWLRLLSPYRQMGISVLIPCYRGYGLSHGSPSEKAIVGDYIDFYDLIAKRPDVDPKRIIFQGRSLGGGVVCALATHRKPAAIILNSTFTSLHQIARELLFPPMLLRDRYDNLKAVANLDCPILITHGQKDTTIPYHHAQQLQAKAPNAQLIPMPFGHNDVMQEFDPDTGLAWGNIQQFLNTNQLMPEDKPNPTNTPRQDALPNSGPVFMPPTR